ncbi:MAG: hypothetical protein K2N70_05625 [Helicobacter sp.]|nr:hypothetical protein [Helicobacter sp.]
MSWATQFKVAIAGRDAEKVMQAFEALPPLERLSKEEAQELYDYLEQSVAIVEEARKHGSEDIVKFKKVRQFLKTNPYGGGNPV